MKYYEQNFLLICIITVAQMCTFFIIFNQKCIVNDRLPLLILCIFSAVFGKLFLIMKLFFKFNQLLLTFIDTVK